MSWADSYIESLLKGKITSFRPKGNSMSGKIESGQLCTLSPDIADLAVGDIVLCKVGGKVYLHLIKAIKQDSTRKSYLIGNNKGHTNGWTSSIYGKLIKVSN